MEPGLFTEDQLQPGVDIGEGKSIIFITAENRLREFFLKWFKLLRRDGSAVIFNGKFQPVFIIFTHWLYRYGQHVVISVKNHAVHKIILDQGLKCVFRYAVDLQGIADEELVVKIPIAVHIEINKIFA